MTPFTWVFRLACCLGPLSLLGFGLERGAHAPYQRSTDGTGIGTVAVPPHVDDVLELSGPPSEAPDPEELEYAEETDRRLTRVCRVTAYCDRGTTASGVQSGVGQCAAPEDIPFGTKVYIPALGRTLVVTDRTHKRFRKNTVDIFVPCKGTAKQFGRKYLECEFIVVEDDRPAAGTRARS